MVEQVIPDRRGEEGRPQARDSRNRRRIQRSAEPEARSVRPLQVAGHRKSGLRAANQNAVEDQPLLLNEQPRSDGGEIEENGLLAGTFGSRDDRFGLADVDHPCIAFMHGQGDGAGNGGMRLPGRQRHGIDDDATRRAVPMRSAADGVDHHRLVVGIVETQIARAKAECGEGFGQHSIRTKADADIGR